MRFIQPSHWRDFVAFGNSALRNFAIDLVFYIQTKPEGITLKEISSRYNVSRRTAERLRDAILNVLPQVDELESDTKEKRWGFIDYSLVI